MSDQVAPWCHQDPRPSILCSSIFTIWLPSSTSWSGCCGSNHSICKKQVGGRTRAKWLFVLPHPRIPDSWLLLGHELGNGVFPLGIFPRNLLLRNKGRQGVKLAASSPCDHKLLTCWGKWGGQGALSSQWCWQCAVGIIWWNGWKVTCYSPVTSQWQFN